MTVRVPPSSSLGGREDVEATGASASCGIHPTSSASNLARDSLHRTPLGNLSPRLLSRLLVSDGIEGENTRSSVGKKCFRKESKDLRT